MRIRLPLSIFTFAIIFYGFNRADERHFFKKNNFSNTAPLRDYLYISKTEVSNRDWLEYIWWLTRQQNDSIYRKALPDTLVWRYISNEPFVEYYLRHPVYQDYPVTGISQKQAMDYCAWLQARIMESENFRESPIEKIIVRLPSENEWVYAAKCGAPEGSVFPWEGKDLRYSGKRNKYKGKRMANVCWDTSDRYEFYLYKPASVESYWPNSLGIYNLGGNVAEWVEEFGQIKGGSFRLGALNARIDAKSWYRKSDTVNFVDVGFRYVIEVVSMKDCDYTVTRLDAKKIERGLMYIPFKDSNTILASNIETSNSLYWQFLQQNTDTALFIKNELWNRFFRYDFYKEYGSHPFFGEYPVVNISYESAVRFCIWLTDMYNSLPKRSYKKVKFRLPTEKEWEFMAYSGRPVSLYPWGGPVTRNIYGRYLANFSPLEEQYIYADSFYFFMSNRQVYRYVYPGDDQTISREADGHLIAAPVDSYFPNDYGCYCVSGNVAEMIAEKGICKGGSWNSHQDNLRIRSREIYDGPSSTLGFRYFMEILEK